MPSPTFDPQALADQFANATTQQTAQLRQAVNQATLSALQGRELSLKNIRSALASVTQAAGAGAAKNPLAGSDVQGLLGSAVAGMDDALLKAVEANRVALSQFVDRGIDLRETQLNKALTDLDKMEDAFLAAIKKGAAAGGEPMSQLWAPVLEKLNVGGTQAGAGAQAAMQQLQQQFDQAHATLRQTRAATLKAAQTMMDGYTALVSGVLIGLSDALKQGSAAPAPAAAEPPAPAAKAAAKASKASKAK